VSDEPQHESPQRLAEAVARTMFGNDPASRLLGMEVVSVGPGQAHMRMTVQKNMLNGHAVCHGGFIFTLADSAFAFACNSQNLSALAAGARIDFLAPGREGDVLDAHASAVSQGKRSGVYDIHVHNQDGKLIALFRGNSSRVGGQVVAREVIAREEEDAS
jgi:acyl-CoA thioesterase